MQEKILFVVRRFGAFIIDLAVWALVVTILTNLYPVDINDWPESVFVAVLLAGVVLLDSISLAWLKTSFGRWLFGVDIQVSFMAALETNLLFWLVLGFGTSTWILALGLIFLLLDYTLHKSWLWDRAFDIKVGFKQMSKIKAVVGIVMILAICLGFYLFKDYDDGSAVSAAVLPSDYSDSSTDKDCGGVVLLHRNDDCEPRFKGWW